MKISHWIIVASFIAPLFACSSSDSSGDGGSAGSTAGSGGATGGTGGAVVTGGSGGATGGTGGSVTGGSGGATGGTGGSVTGGSGGGTTSQCTISYDDPTCDPCFQQKCEATCVAVMNEPTVQEYGTCYGGCATDDDACTAACDAQYPAAAAAFDAFIGCMGDQCPDECGGGSCIIQWTDATCDDCFQAACATECETYSLLPDGPDHFNCILACTDSACEDACDGQYPDAAQPLSDIWACAGSNCSDECGINNTTSECGMISSTQTCNDCFDANCFDECKAVADHADVSNYLTCYNACGDQACADGCDTQYPEISALFTTFDTCITDNCSTECAAP